MPILNVLFLLILFYNLITNVRLLNIKGAEEGDAFLAIVGVIVNALAMVAILFAAVIPAK
jgi:hypothetical protein